MSDTRYEILMERKLDPAEQRPIGVYETYEAAFNAKLGHQRARALDANRRRSESFQRGEAVGRLVSYEDFEHTFYIQSVRTVTQEN